LENNSETVNVQTEEQTQDTVASAAEPVQESALSEERAPLGVDGAVEATIDAPPPDGEGTDDEPVDEALALQEALAEAQAQASEYLDGWQRARAEFANYRRREELRREQSAGEISARVLGHFLPVLDDLERAFSSIPPEVEDSPWLEGLSLVAQKMLSCMEQEGVAVMPTEQGDAFDPNYHMAVLHSPCADYDEGQIAMVLQRGYTMGERVLRPAMVQVSSGKPCDAGAGDTGAGTADEPADEPTDERND
jgi:molecular chaperone GrpE